MTLSTLFTISRPRFWHYVLWPMLIYFASSWYLEQIQSSFLDWWVNWIFQFIIMLIILWYFTLPANLWIYGWNDIADGDTDKFNTKKGSYEAKIEDTTSMKTKLKWHIWWWNIGYIIVWYFIISLIGVTMDCFPLDINNYMCSGIIESPWIVVQHALILFFSSHLWIILWYLTIFLLTSYLYSCRPLRAKAKPFIDGIMNILYIATPFTIISLQYVLWWPSLDSIQFIIYNILASWFWVIAMHCYSAIPDIEPDRKAWLNTTAVYLGKQNALIYCSILYLGSAFLAFPTLWWFSIIWWIAYLSVMIISYYRQDVFALYKLFPYINLIVWFLLFRYIILYI